VAAQCFASTGYRQTTLEEIARHAGVAKASMYRYFENKQELLAKIFIKVATTFARGLQPLLVAPLAPEEKLRRTVQDLLRTIGEMGRSLLSFTVKKRICRPLACGSNGGEATLRGEFGEYSQ